MASSPTAMRSEVLARIEKMGNLEVVPIASMRFDKNYQRDLRNHFAKKLAQDMRLSALGFPVVSRRADGKLYVVNGQHRIAAATMNGLTEMDCLVINGMDEKQEAELRLTSNVHMPESSLESFKAKVAAKHPEALDIVALVARYDSKINETPTQASGINCIGALEHLYDLDKGATLTQVFDVIKDAWGRVEGEYAAANIFKAVAWMLEAHEQDDNFSRARFVEKLRETGPAALTMKMHAHRAIMAGSQWLNMYRGMVEVYNERLSEAARLSLKSRGWAKRAKETGDWTA